jgi:uncharacterized protein YcbX
MQLSGLSIYPIKSCGGIDLSRAKVERRGLERDRRFMLVDEQGVFVTQRQEGVLARTRLVLRGDTLEVSAPGRAPLSLLAEPRAGQRMRVRVWDDHTEGLVQPEASSWFSELVGRPLFLVYMPPDVQRAVDPRYAQPTDVVGFADGFPLLLISEASLEELERRLGRAVEMRRFRPNLVVKGALPHAEDEWPRFRVGSIGFRAVKPCARCMITTRDPDSGERGLEPLATLAGYRSQDGKVLFGMNVIPDGEGELRIGDEVAVL